MKVTARAIVGVATLCVTVSVEAAQGEHRRNAAHGFFGGFDVAGKIVIDAASAKQIVAPMRLSKDPEAAKGKSLEVPSSGLRRGAIPEGHAVFEFDVKEEGVYCLHVRATWPGPADLPTRATSADRPRSIVFVSLDGRPRIRLGGRTMGHRHWACTRRRLFRLRKGKHTLKIAILGRGVALDQILLTADKEYVPVGIEK